MNGDPRAPISSEVLGRGGRLSRRQLVKLLGAGASAAAASPLIAACTPTQSAPPAAATTAVAATPTRGGILQIGYVTEIASLDPHKSPGEDSLRFFDLVYSRLLKLDKDLAPTGDLAETFDVSPDGLRYTFRLRGDTRFSNGDPLTSEDVKVSFDRILDPKTVAIGRSFFESVKSIEAPDARTVVFTQSAPNAALPVYLTSANCAIVSAKLLRSGADLSNITNALGSGPFKVDRWVPDSTMELSRNPRFYEQGRPYLDGVKVNVIPNADSLIAAMRSGAIDFTFTEDTRVGKLAAAGSLNVIKTADLARYQLLVNTSRPPFDNVDVRTAISYALDRTAIIAAASLGEGVPAGPLGGLPRFALPATEFPSWKRDLTKARELLAKAGHPNGFRFELLTQQSNPGNAPLIAQAVQSQLKEVGITADIKLMEFAAWVQRWQKADFDMAPGRSAGAPDPDFLLFRYFYSKGNLNHITGGWKSAELDQSLLKGQSTADFAARKAAYDRVQKILVDGLPMIWLYSAFLYSLLGPRVRDFTPRANHTLDGLRDTWLAQ